MLATTAEAAGVDQVASAQDAAARLDYAQATTLAKAAIESGQLPPSKLLTAYALLGEISAAENKPEAESWFVRTLELDPAFTLGPDVSPKVVAPFQRAKKRLSGHHLDATETTEPKS